MVKVLALAPFILGLIAVACGGGASPTAGVAPGAQQAQEAPPVEGAFNADIKDFAHQDITVAVGTTVAWTNRGNAPHTTTETSDTEIWDSKSMQPGESFSFTFSEAGTFDYFCAIHPTMKATVTVTAQRAPAETPTREAAPTRRATSTETVAPAADAGGGTESARIVDFAHQDLKVAVGTAVTWTNRGQAIHTTTSRDGLWESGVLENRQAFSFTFVNPGSFAYFCAIHPRMTATITVTGPPGDQPAPTTAAAATSTPIPTLTATPTTAPRPTAIAAATAIPEPQPTSAPAAGDAPVALTANADMVKFTHVDLTVEAGTDVVWTNLDPSQHTVTSGSPSDPDPGSLFDSGSDKADWVVQGATYSFTFNEAGVFPYYCRVHGGGMSGTVTVTAASSGAVAPTPLAAPTTVPAATPDPILEPTLTGI